MCSSYCLLIIGTYFNNQTCSIQQSAKQEDTNSNHEWGLHDAIFDCDILPSCHMTCSGPNIDKLQTMARECGCIMEWFVHSVWLKSVISLVIFALLNASRQGFVDGLARLCWKSLHPGAFTVWATCDNGGKFLTQSVGSISVGGTGDVDEDVVEDMAVHEEKGVVKRKDLPSQSIRMGSEIKKQIDWNSKVFRLSGVAMMIVAFLLNAPWILLLWWSPNTILSPKWLA